MPKLLNLGASRLRYLSDFIFSVKIDEGSRQMYFWLFIRMIIAFSPLYFVP